VDVEPELWIVTDAAGFVQECSPAALQLLGYSSRGARGRELTNMFVAERPRLAELLDAARGGVVERRARLRPNDRRCVDVQFRIERLKSDEPEPRLLWTVSLRWPITLRIPRGVDRRQIITMWRSGALRCVFVPGGAEKRRLLVCEQDEVLIEEAPPDAAAALVRAGELQRLTLERPLASRNRQAGS
jgi:PAS domain S-box-containing protein